MSQKQRILTVSGVWTPTAEGGRNRQFPFIRLQGKWVEKLGFDIGSKIQVTYQEHGELNIKLVKEESGQ